MLYVRQHDVYTVNIFEYLLKLEFDNLIFFLLTRQKSVFKWLMCEGYRIEKDL